MSEALKLSDRVRPSVEAAPWVVNAIKKLEDRLEAQQGASEVATHLGWDFLDDGTKVATYFIRVAGDTAPKLYTHPVAAPVSRTSVELLSLAEHLLNSEVFNNDGLVRSVTQEERDELRARIEKHLTEMPVQP